jgi:RNA polymerase sigma-70 factor (ECF subfamily)
MYDIATDLRDPHTFERAYKEHRARAFAAALGVLRDPAAAEDVVQDVFAQLWRRPRAFDSKRGLLRSYITMMARSRAVDRWRTQTARDAAVERLAATAGEPRHEQSADERAIERESSAHVVSILHRLPPPQREAVLLAYGKELTAREIAEVMGVPLGTAKSRVRLGLEKMRETAEDAG